MPLTNQQVRVLRQIFEKEREGIERGLGQSAEPIPETVQKAIVAQNFIRGALEIAIDESMPFDRRFIAELAIRITSYIISAAPIEDHESLVGILIQNLPEAHRRRVKDGIIIKTDWETGGYTRPNVPSANEVN